MEIGLLIAIGFALAFALTNGFHDASNAIATLVATRGATAGQAVVLSAVFNMAGAVLLGTAVADTIGKIVTYGVRREYDKSGCWHPNLSTLGIDP